jgi:hypothetical protein
VSVLVLGIIFIPYGILSLVPPKEVFFFSQCSRSGPYRTVFLLDPDPRLRTEFELRIPSREANDLRIRPDPDPTAWPFLLPLEKYVVKKVVNLIFCSLLKVRYRSARLDRLECGRVQ